MTARRKLGFAWAACALALALACCVSLEELRREDEARCAGYGFQPGTDAFAACLQRENLARLYLTPPPSLYWGYWAYWGAFWGPHWRHHHHFHGMAHGARHRH